MAYFLSGIDTVTFEVAVEDGVLGKTVSGNPHAALT
jgi:hypothetical protein